MIAGLFKRFRKLVWQFRGVRIGPKSYLGRHASIPRFARNISLGVDSYVDDFCTLLVSRSAQGYGQILIGNKVYINRYFFADSLLSIEIGDDTMIGPYVYITDSDHDFKSGEPIGESGFLSRKVHIGKNVWIGAHAVILKGVTIGDGAVIAAGAVVTRNVSAGTVVKGIPAK